MEMDQEGTGGRLSVSKSGEAVIARVRKEDDGAWVCRGVDPEGNWINAEPIKLIVLGEFLG